MSDARPITNITDFVCGSCWNSFSRSDPGVVRGNELVCPHCGHVLPLDGATDVADAVRAAQPTEDVDSGTYASDGQLAADAPGFPSLDGDLSYGWSAREAVPPPDAAGFMVGEPDDFGTDEPTLRPDLNHADLLALVRAAPSRPVSGEDDVSGEWGSPVDATGSALTPDTADFRFAAAAARATDGNAGFVAGDEISADVDEPTPLESDERVRKAVATLLAAEAADPAAAARARTPSQQPAAEAGPQAVVFAAGAEPGDSDSVSRDTLSETSLGDLDPSLVAALQAADEPRLEDKDWKLKAMGLTYNFHGLDALIGWASNKAGQPLSISMDGNTWKDFGTFFDGYKDGLGALKSFEEAAEPGAAPPASQRTRPTATTKASTQAPDLGRPGTPPADDKPALQMPGGNDGLDRALGSSGASRTVPAVTGLPGAAVTGKNPSLPSGKGVGPASSPSRRTPVAAAKVPAKEAPTPAKIAVAVAVVAVLVVVLLHVLGVFRIPGLGS